MTKVTITVDPEDVRAVHRYVVVGWQPQKMRSAVDRLLAALPWEPSEADIKQWMAAVYDDRDVAVETLTYLHEAGLEVRPIEIKGPA